MSQVPRPAAARGRAIPAVRLSPIYKKSPGTPDPAASAPQRQDAAAASKHAARIVRHRNTALISTLLVGGTFFGYCTLLYISTTRPADQTIPSPKTQEELTVIYDKTANSFDADLGTSEWLAGITNARRDIVSQCRGHVLEVSAGTARNLGYYKFGGREGVRSLTLVDISKEMVEQGKLKWAALKSQGKLQGFTKGVPVRFWQGDVKSKMPEPPLPTEETTVTRAGQEGLKKGYDTVVQTMGLCSTDEPVELLHSIASHLDRSNPEAKIFLIEHGKSHYDWINRILDNQAPMHACKHGCWWNRDIGQIVRDSGLEIVQEKRMSLGTTWIYELRPGQVQKQATLRPKLKRDPDSTSEESTGLSAWLPRWTYEKICKR